MSTRPGSRRQDAAINGRHSSATVGRSSRVSGRFAAKKSPPTPHDWGAWVGWLARRSEPQPLHRLALTAAGNSPLLWGLTDQQPDSRVSGTSAENRQPGAHDGGTAASADTFAKEIWRDIVQYSGKVNERSGQWAGTLEQWLEQPYPAEPDLRLALEAVAWSHVLPDLAQVLTAAPWCALLERLVHLAQDAAGLSWDRAALASQLLGGELPLTLAYLLPEIDACRRLWDRGASHLSHGIVELLDGEGLPHGRHLSIVRLLLASWTRCGLLGRSENRQVFDAAATEQYAWLVRQSLRLSREDGSSAWSSDSTAGSLDLFRTALHIAQDPISNGMAAAMLPSGTLPSPAVAGKLPESSLHSEWSEAAILQQNWSCGAARLLVSYFDGCVRTELQSQSRLRWSGSWDIGLKRDGQPLVFSGEWEEVCWVSDSDGDYLELQAELSGEGIVQRQIYLARGDNFLMLADAYLGAASGAIEYIGKLPLGAGQSFCPQRDTHEGVLRNGRRWARSLPLALPEWRTAAVRGKLTQVGDVVQLEQRASGLRLFAPLFIDLDPRRLAKQVTWRQLTVAEKLVIQSPDVAVGYRVQVGDRNWLVYRSLAEKGNRTVVGQNFSTTFVLARLTEGEAEKLIEIE